MLPTVLNAFNVVVMRNFFLNLPLELLDSTQMDGAGELTLLIRISQSTLAAVTSAQLQQALPPQRSLDMAILVVSILIVYPLI